MNKIILCLFFTGMAVLLLAQEGIAYTKTKEVHEKYYEVRQKNGRNVMTLTTTAKGFYDDEGDIIDKHIYKANRTYLGRIKKNKSKNPYTVETLNYDYMNQLTLRSVVLYGDDPRESTSLEYDAKGKILNKTSTRIRENTDELWQLDYNQVGYIYQYFQVGADSTGKVMVKHKYNYYDDIVEMHYYIYDDKGMQQGLLAMSTSDTLVFKREYIHDDKGNLIEENLYNHKDKIVETERYTYDDKNRIIQKSFLIWNPRFGVVPNLRKQWDYEYVD